MILSPPNHPAPGQAGIVFSFTVIREGFIVIISERWAEGIRIIREEAETGLA
jgi:hypothetical protein